jgi:putative ABC transport system ATP-binding protein
LTARPRISSSLFEELNKEGRTIVVVTHALDVAERAQRCITILDGQIIKGQDDSNRPVMLAVSDPT